MASHATKCVSLVKGRRLRVTKLDGCGRPIYGDDSQVVSKGFISVALTANTTESDEINVTNAAGEVCVYEAAVTSLVGYGIEIQFCNVDPELFALVTGQPVVLGADGSTVIGWDVDTKIGLENSNFALELWAGSPAADTCTTPGATGSYGYLLMPYLTGGILGDFTIENGAVTFTLTSANTKEGNAWGVGPYQDIMLDGGSPTPAPGPMATPVSSTTALRTMIVDLAPPEDECGARPVLDPSLPDITNITATPDGVNTKEIDFTTTPVATGPVWWEFGDGTWDYVAAPGATSHTYAEAGTYTVRASQNGVWFEKQVVVS
jgi:hypothetical protein